MRRRARQPRIAPFPPGALVRQRSRPHGEPGLVVALRRGLVLVEWRDLGGAARHAPGNLQLACAAFATWPPSPAALS